MRRPVTAITLPFIVLLLIARIGLAQPATRLLSNEIAQFDDILEESSGLAWHDGKLWTHNDSGDSARLFQVDPQGTILREVMVSNVRNVDWESMAHDAEYLYIADTGNNANRRSQLQIYRIAWDDLVADQVEADVIELRYADYQPGNPTAHNFDAEGLTVRGNELWLFSKSRGDRQSKLYRFPKLPGSYSPRPSQTLPVNALITAADIHPQTGRLVLLAWRGSEGTFVWSAPTSSDGVDIAAASEVQLSPSDQWEAVLFDPQVDNRVYLTHENNTQGYAALAWILLE